MYTPIYQVLQPPTNPTTALDLNDSESIHSTGITYYYKITPPEGKHPLNSTQEPIIYPLKRDANNNLLVRLRLMPSVGSGKSASYKAQLYKMTSFAGPSYPIKPKTTFLKEEYWYIPNPDKTVNRTYRHFLICRDKKQFTNNLKALEIEGTGQYEVDLTAHPEVIEIDSISDDLKSYNFYHDLDTSYSPQIVSSLIFKDSAPLTKFTIKYFAPLLIEDILYRDYKSSLDTIVY